MSALAWAVIALLCLGVAATFVMVAGLCCAASDADETVEHALHAADERAAA